MQGVKVVCARSLDTAQHLLPRSGPHGQDDIIVHVQEACLPDVVQDGFKVPIHHDALQGQDRAGLPAGVLSTRLLISCALFRFPYF